MNNFTIFQSHLICRLFIISAAKSACPDKCDK